MIHDVAILGGGPGGYTAALYCARAGFSTVVIEKLSVGGQMATTEQIDNYPGFEQGVDGYELGEKMQKGAERFGALTHYATVQTVELTQAVKKIVTTKGDLLARAVVLAMGAHARELGLPEEALLRNRGVAYCAACDGRQYRGKRVVVVGGGNSAAADALYLAKLCESVTLIHRRDSLRATRLYLQALKDSGIRFLWNSRVTAILHDTRVTGVRVESTDGEVRNVLCDGLFVAIGRMPETDLVRGQVELDTQGYILADETTRTSLPGVFAVGDIRTKPLRQIVTATADGAVAAHFIEAYLA